MTIILITLAAILIVLPAMILGTNNSAEVIFDYFWGTQTFSLSSLVAVSFFVGVCFASLFWVVFTLKLKVQAGSLQRQLQNQSNDNSN